MLTAVIVGGLIAVVGGIIIAICLVGVVLAGLARGVARGLNW